MGFQLRIRFTHELPARHCPRCESADIWRWAKDRSIFRPIAVALGRHLMTCRSCNHKFYVTKRLAESPLVHLLAKLTGQPVIVTKPKVAFIGKRASRPVRAHELPALKVSFAEWERRHAQQAAKASAAPKARSG